MPRALLIPAPSVGQDRRLRPYVPLGLLSLRAHAEDLEGLAVEIWYPELDDGPPPRTSADLAEALALRLGDLSELAVVGLATLCGSFHHTLGLAAALKARRADLPIWLGGPQASAVASELLAVAPSVDAVFIGEAEESFPEALRRLAGGEPTLAGVAGVVTRAGPGSPRPPLADLDQLRQVRLDEADLRALRRQHPEGEPALPLEVARGCPGRCTFCSTRRHWGRKVRRKSDARVLEEMRRLAGETGLLRFEIVGDNFGASLARLRGFCRAKAREAPDLLWMCDTRLDRLAEGDLDLLWDAGCRGFFVGLESASRETLARLRKDVDLGRALAVIEAAAARGFNVKASFIAGFPWETAESLKQTFELFCSLRRGGAAQCQLWLACPLPGTELAEAHEVVFDRFGSRLAMDGLPLDEGTRALARAHPRLFSQLGRFVAPDLDPVELIATIQTAFQYDQLLATSARRSPT